MYIERVIAEEVKLTQEDGESELEKYPGSLTHALFQFCFPIYYKLEVK